VTRALVTGAASGIGQATAWRLAAAGANVACLDVNQEGLAETMSAMDGGVAVEVDITDAEAVERAVKDAAIGLGGLDAVANVAGIGDFSGDVTETPVDEWNRVLAVNLSGMYHVSRSAIPHLRAAGGGAIVNISSRSSDMVMPSFVAYGTAKAALNMMTRNLAAELAPRVRINAISVGGVATQSLEVVLTDDTLRAQFEAGTPMRRPGEPEDIACAALYLASPASSWVTGKIFQIDGGTEAPSISVPVAPIEPAT